MLPGKKYTPHDLLNIARKRWWMALVPAVVGAIGSAFYAYSLPNQYRAETLIMVMPQQIPEAYIRTMDRREQPRVEDRLAALQQQVLSRARLERVIADFNLYPEQRRQMPLEDVVELMRRDISTQSTRGDVFALRYVSSSARSAKEVAERLGSMFIDENLRNRMTTADSTSQFLQAQLEDTRKKLEQIEAKRAQFRQQYMGQLPEQVTSNLAVLNSTQMRAQSLTDANAADLIRKASLERQIAELRGSPRPSNSATDANEPQAGALPPPSQTSVQLAQAQDALTQLRLRLRDDHPDIRRLRATIAELQAQLDRESAQRAISPTAPGPRQPVTDPNAPRLAELQSQLEAVTAAIRHRETELTRLNGLLGQYQGRIQTTPALENQLMQIERDYETYRKQYDDLLSKSQAAEMTAGVEQRQIGEQFRILDAARVPERPFSPNRERLILLGLFAGLALGVGLIGVLEFLDTSFHAVDDVVTVLALPVVAAIPVLRTQSELRLARRRRFAVSVGTAVVVLGSIGFLFVKYGL